MTNKVLPPDSSQNHDTVLLPSFSLLFVLLSFVAYFVIRFSVFINGPSQAANLVSIFDGFSVLGVIHSLGRQKDHAS